MDKKRQIEISKFLSLILRHKPENIGLDLDANGWADVEKLLTACAGNKNAFTRDELEKVVAENDKKRFAFNEDGTKIRANQGHSIRVEIEFEKKIPPEVLYHGTAETSAATILEKGLRKMRRHHVHLSKDMETARKVGARYGKPVILEIDTRRMMKEGFEFYVSANGIWLIDEVPPKFLKVL